MMFSKLLLIEDNIGTKNRFTDILEEHYTVTGVSTIDHAEEELRRNKSEEMKFDLIVLDLNISCNTVLLTKEEKAKTDNSMLTGWVWVYKNLLSEDSFAESKLYIMILSSYITDLDRYLKSEDNAAEKEAFDKYVEQKKLKTFEKSGVGEKCKLLVDYIKDWSV